MSKPRLTVEMCKELRQRLKAKASLQGKSISQVIKELIEGYLNEVH